MATMTISYCYDEAAKNKEKLSQARFCRKVKALLPADFKIEFRFNPGGIAVWGETFVKITREAKPVVEACLSKDHSYMRQWDGNRSGRNITLCHLAAGIDPAAFVQTTKKLADEVFRPF